MLKNILMDKTIFLRKKKRKEKKTQTPVVSFQVLIVFSKIFKSLEYSLSLINLFIQSQSSVKGSRNNRNILQMNPTTIKSWLLRGELEKLEHVVLEGRGARLLGEHSPDLRTRVFLKGLPNYLVNYC